MVSVVLPTYNEREGIGELVAEILAVARRAGLDLEVLVVDDASPDGTAAHVESASRATRPCAFTFGETSGASRARSTGASGRRAATSWWSWTPTATTIPRSCR